MRLIVTALLCVGLSQAQQGRDEPIPQRPPVTPEEIAAGERLFNGHCAGCHGPGGRGGSGPLLARPDLRRAKDPQSLFLIIDLGIDGTEMPRGWQLHDQEIWKIAAYVESLGKIEPEPLPGDPGRGKAVYQAQGCAGCHWINGAGGAQGPELSDLGVRRSLGYIRESITDPAAAFPERYVVVSALLADGKKVEGVRLAEDPFSIQIRTLGGALLSLDKAGLKDLVQKKGVSTMPAYDSLSAAELDDLVSYLATLRGRS